MTDLSKIPDLELRQKVKVLSDAIDKIDAKIEEVTAPLYEERNKIEKQREQLLGDRYLSGFCERTGLPIFDDDVVIERRELADVES